MASKRTTGREAAWAVGVVVRGAIACTLIATLSSTDQAIHLQTCTQCSSAERSK